MLQTSPDGVSFWGDAQLYCGALGANLSCGIQGGLVELWSAGAADVLRCQCCRCHGGNFCWMMIFLIYFSVILVLFPERLEEWDDHWCITCCSLKTCENQQHGDEMTWHCRPFLWKREEIYRNLTLFSLTSAVVVLFMMTLTLLCARQDGWEAGCQMVALNGQKSLLEWKSDPGIRGIPYIYIYNNIYI